MNDVTGRLIAAAVVVLAGAVLVVGFFGNGRYEMRAVGGEAGLLDTRTGAIWQLAEPGKGYSSPPALWNQFAQLSDDRGATADRWWRTLAEVDPVNALVFVFLALAYFLPTFFAFRDQRERRVRIAVLNVLFGWTVVGWYIVLLRSLTRERPSAKTEE